MFEATKLGRTVSKEFYKEQEPELRYQLLEIQRKLATSKTSVVVVVYGVDGAGKGEVVNLLNEWLDTRGMETFAFWDETPEDKERPRYWRFWRSMPPRGQISILFGAWYMEPMQHRMQDLCDDAQLDDELKRIEEFERMLTEDGALLVKFWFHLPKDEQKKRLKKLAADDRSRWKMDKNKPQLPDYEKFEKISERMIRQTDNGLAPWFLIEATDRRYRDLTVGRTLLKSINTRLEQPDVALPASFSHAPALPTEPSAQVTVLDHVDLGHTLDKVPYKKRLQKAQDELNLLAWEAYHKKRSTVLVFEGWDASGKGGAIRRVTTAIDARLYRSIQIAAPTDEEKAHHYLWRFWRHIPRAGRLTIYDRSWYGRVLVERVEGFASQLEWRRAYSEINSFEEQLVESGVILAKFWIHISKEEQLKRFKEREAIPYKQHKITDEDWRNREKWDLYKGAVNEMVIRTSTEFAPWTLVGGNDKPSARVQVLETICDALRKGLKQGAHSPDTLSPCKKAR
jgi:AMP-polyphosphate phosphotransferase